MRLHINTHLKFYGDDQAFVKSFEPRCGNDEDSQVHQLTWVDDDDDGDDNDDGDGDDGVDDDNDGDGSPASEAETN